MFYELSAQLAVLPHRAERSFEDVHRDGNGITFDEDFVEQQAFARVDDVYFVGARGILREFKVEWEVLFLKFQGGTPNSGW